MSIQEAEAFADNGFGTVKESDRRFGTTTTAESRMRAKGENLLLSEEGAAIAKVRHDIQNKMLDYAGSTAKGVHELVKKFDEFFGNKQQQSEIVIGTTSDGRTITMKPGGRKVVSSPKGAKMKAQPSGRYARR
jgi:hypothetical protein